ncbi:prolipoprotein diacylglyceryl transferase [Myxococcota bacterium]|nr:prolipoprotein diacylglyceryl transferase [Myxococcota bacterium]
MSETVEIWRWVLTSVPHAIDYLAAWFGGGLILLIGASVLARDDGIAPGRIAGLLALLTVTTVVGARAHALLFESGVSLEQLAATPGRLLEPGWRLPGGLFLSLCMSVPLSRMLGVPWRALADATLPFLGIFFAFGRLGCLLRGCCMGHTSTLPWALPFGPETEVYAHHMSRGLLELDAPTSLAVHPLPLYLGLGGLLISFGLLWYRPRRLFRGEVGLLGVALIGLLMSSGEWMRDTEMMRPVALRTEIPLVLAVIAAAAWGVLASMFHRRSDVRPGSPKSWIPTPESGL